MPFIATSGHLSSNIKMEQEFHYVRQNPDVYGILAECYLIYISNITKNVEDDYKILSKKSGGKA